MDGPEEPSPCSRQHLLPPIPLPLLYLCSKERPNYSLAKVIGEGRDVHV